MNVPIVWIMGGPGSGKSTLSQNIVDKYSYKHLDPSDMVEREIEAKTENGKQFAEKRNKGEEVMLNEIISLIEEEVMRSRGGLKGFVIDGYPQNQNDAEILEERIGSPDLVIALQVNQETSMARNSARGSTITSTISFFTTNAAPVLAQYSQRLVQVDGERDAQAILDDVRPNMDIITKNYGHKITIQR